MSILPPSRPAQKRAVTENLLRKAGLQDPPVALVGIRGYYLDTMGEPGTNDRGIYDDAILLVSRQAHIAYNANCDPSAFRPRIATLVPGVWRYRVGTHGLSKPPERRYEALVQAGPVSVSRDGVAGLDTGWFGINIHRGGRNTTSSEGCQTIHPDQWPSFIETVKQEMKRAGVKEIPYLLVNGQ